MQLPGALVNCCHLKVFAILDTPRSDILAIKLEVSKMLLAVRSQWTMEGLLQ